MPAWPSTYDVHPLGDLTTQSGEVISDAKLGWRTHGRLSADRGNVVLYPTSFGSRSDELAWLIGENVILDPTRWFIIQMDMFGNGLSSSPSNTSGYPDRITAFDNVQAQARLLEVLFGVRRLHAVYGWSMGAQQAYHWAALHPDAVDNAIIVCGSARTAVHNQVFLRSLMSLLEASREYTGGGRFRAPPRAALRAFALTFASWSLSQDFYRAGLHLSTSGAADLDAFLHARAAQQQIRDPVDLLAHLRCWDAGDISDNPLYGGDLQKALAAISARVLLLPAETDLYFRVADNAAELPHLRRASLSPIPGPWGHRAGNPVSAPTEAAYLRNAVRQWLG